MKHYVLCVSQSKIHAKHADSEAQLYKEKIAAISLRSDSLIIRCSITVRPSVTCRFSAALEKENMRRRKELLLSSPARPSSVDWADASLALLVSFSAAATW